MQIVLNIISVLAFGISVYSLIHQIIKSKLNLKIELNHAVSNAATPYWYYLDLDIINKSNNPISIYSIKILIKNNLISVQKEKDVLVTKTSRTGKTVTNVEHIYSQELPFEIQGYLAKSGKFILNLKEIQAKLSENHEYFLFIYTSRGKVKRKISIGNIIYDIKQLL